MAGARERMVCLLLAVALTSQLHLIALNVLITFGMTCTTVTLSFILQCVNIFLEFVVSILM
jgi:hypothetical protein